MMLNSIALFPQASQSLLINQEAKLRILKLLEFFIREIIETIIAFYYEKKLSEFDPHVGETLCQIRAYKTLLLFMNIKFDLKVIAQELEKFKEIQLLVAQRILAFEQLIKNKGSKYNKQLDRHEQLDKFLQGKNLLFDISNNIFYLFQGRLLSNFSTKDNYGISMAIDYEKLSMELKTAKAFARKLSRYYQQNLAQLSCDFIMKLLSELPQLEDLQYVLPYLQVTDNHGRKIFPCYEATFILLRHMLRNKVSILLISDRQNYIASDVIPLLFKVNKEATDFELVKNSDKINPGMPCVIIKGITKYQGYYFESIREFSRRILCLGILNIILCNMAKHPQYSAKELEFISDCHYSFFLGEVDNLTGFSADKYGLNIALKNSGTLTEMANNLKKDLLNMKQLAQKEGCCIDNPSLFFIKHIFCSTFAEQFPKYNFGTYSLLDNQDVLVENKKVPAKKYLHRNSN